MTNQQIEISFVDIDDRTAGHYCNELQEIIAHKAPSVAFSRKRTDEEAQDLGAILLLILGLPITIEVAKEIVKGIFEWLKHKNTIKQQKDMIKIKISVGDKAVEIECQKGISDEELTHFIERVLTSD